MTDKPIINAIYKFNSEYNPVYVNGVYGGLTPTGEIVANFYLERPPVPKEVTYVISEGGRLGEVIEMDPENHATNIVRFVSHGIVMNVETAKGLRSWLDRWIERKEESTNEHSVDGDLGRSAEQS